MRWRLLRDWRWWGFRETRGLLGYFWGRCCNFCSITFAGVGDKHVCESGSLGSLGVYRCFVGYRYFLPEIFPTEYETHSPRKLENGFDIRCLRSIQEYSRRFGSLISGFLFSRQEAWFICEETPRQTGRRKVYGDASDIP